ncbi:MAG: hypothetical protein C4526_07630 [Nitrospiraceae bacterium]|nr:MAG: hypothetical protein C4526_07630 [Nitrospiraceae bacterium]
MRMHIGPVVFIVLTGIALWSLFPSAPAAAQAQVIGSRERVKVIGPAGTVEAIARIDTGAASSSIDDDFASRIGLKVDPFRERIVISAAGRHRRPVVDITVVIGGRTISSTATVAERGTLSTDILIGRRDLGGFTIDPAREFLAEPGEARQPSLVSRYLRDVFNEPGSREIAVFPVMASAIVVLRLIAGVATFGIFAPTVIAFSLIELDILQGALIYLFLVITGMAVKHIVLRRFRLPHIAELSLIMFLLVILLMGISAFLSDVSPSFSKVFFPLIITSFLIEHATRAVEEHRVREAVLLLFSTIATAVLLGLAGRLLVVQSYAVISVSFVLAFITALIAGRYRGLRLTELFRFRLLRQGRGH